MTSKNKTKLTVPPSDNGLGLFLFCGNCNAQVSGSCKENNLPLAFCNHTDSLYYKVAIREKGERNKRKTKKLVAKTLPEAMIEASIFKLEVKEKKAKTAESPEGREKSYLEHPVLLEGAMAKYSSFLRNENLPQHMHVQRSNDHLKDIDRALAFLEQSLLNAGYSLATFQVNDINDFVVGDIHSALKAKKFSGRTINKYMSAYYSFMKHYAQYHFPVTNYFSHGKREPINPMPQIISETEFEALIASINQETDVRTYTMIIDGIKKKIRRRMFRPWLADAFRLCLETGRRREEVVRLKWNGIDEASGTITSEDYKANRIQRLSGDKKKYIDIPLTPTLKSLLKTLGYEQYAGTDKYILAPEISISRGRVMSDIMSRAFSHYYAKLNTGKSLTLKSLRKTYITTLYQKIGPSARLITGHSSDAIMEGSYVNKKKIAGSISFEGVYPQNDRNEELKELRSRIDNTQSKNPEIE